MTLNKFIRAHPSEKIFAAVPGRENYVWVAIVNRSQDLVGNKARHAVDQTRPLAKPLFEGSAVVRRDKDAIGDSDHSAISFGLMIHVAQALVCDTSLIRRWL